MKRKRWTVLAVFAMVVALLPLSAVPAAAAGVAINEIRIDQPGTDIDEYFELAGDPGASLSGMTYLVIGDGSGGSGVIEAVVDLTGYSIPTSGYFVAAESTFTLGTADLTTTLNFENSDNVTHLLVSGFTGSSGTDLDTDDDGTLDVAPWTAVVDSVALVETVGSGDKVYSATTVGPDGSFVPGQVYLCESWEIGAFNPIGGDDTPGAANVCTTPPPAPELGACGDSYTPIYAIQGSGSASPLDGSVVRTEGVVVGDFQEGNELKGFALQDPIGDGDVATSDGIFVYYGFWNGQVDVGDHVRVLATVDEFFGLTELTSVDDLAICGTGVSVAPTAVSLPVADTSDWEPYEGMLVTFPQALTISEYYNFDRFGEIVLTTNRQFQATSLYEPGSSQASDVIAANKLARITLDDGSGDENPEFARHPDGAAFTLSNRFRGGDTVANVTGVVDYAFGKYKIQPTTGADYEATNPRPSAAPGVGGTLRVASANVLNFFTHIDNGTNLCGPKLDTHQCRGADTVDEFQRQRDKILAEISGLDADVVGLEEVENDIYGVDVDGNRKNDAILTLVEALNAFDGAGTWAWVGEANYYNDYPVRNEIIYRTATVEPVGDPIAYENDAFDKEKGGYPVGRPPLAQTFMEKATGEVFTVVANHFKSKGSSCSVFDDPYDPFQANCNLTRVAQSEALLDFVGQLQADTLDPDVLIMGDLNSYAKEDPIDVLVGAGFTNLHQLFEGTYAYSYVFDGQLGYLDHALANPSMLLQVTGAAAWHINADEPDILNYDMSYKKPAQDALYEPNAFRASDHDPVIVGLSLAPVELTATPDTLWPTNHKYVSVTVTATVAGTEIPVVIVSVESSEDDSGYNKGDKPDDVGATDGDTVMLRAERFTSEGRVYTIMVSAFDGSWTGTVDVVVPHDMGKRKKVK